MKQHRYKVRVKWVGNRGTGTSAYLAYSRDHEIGAGDKPVIPGSSDPSFNGDKTRWNPEDLLVASLSACHKLWYLHLCSISGIVVASYDDDAEGIMEETEDGSGRFQEVVLHPRVTIAAGQDESLAERLHHDAHAKCFIANSVCFPVHCVPEIAAASR